MDNLSNNIKFSINHVSRMKRYILGSVQVFSQHYHLSLHSLNSFKLYLECKTGKLELPDTKKLYKSYSTASELRPNMIDKTDMINMVLVDHYLFHDISKSTINKFKQCGKCLEFAIGHDKDTGFKHHHELRGFNCDFKYCPIRQHIRAKQRFNKINTNLKYNYFKYGYCPIFLTFTIPNIKPTAYRIRKAYKLLTNSWKKMSHYRLYDGDNRFTKKNKGILKGWIEKFEYTYNSRQNTLHPHIHIIGLVRKSYLNKFGSKYYVKHSQFLSDWQRAVKNANAKEVFVEAPYYKDKAGNKTKIQDCKTKIEQEKCLAHSAKEISKYMGKSVDFNKLPHVNTGKLTTSMFGRNRKDVVNYLNKILTNQQFNSVKAFHAIYRGLKGCKVLHFGGYCAKANWLYNKATKEHDKKAKSIMKPYMSIPNVVYEYKIKSTFNFNMKDYADEAKCLTKNDIKLLEQHNLEVNPIDPNKSNARKLALGPLQQASQACGSK